MIRTETIAVPVARGEPGLRNVFGFTWDAGAPENTAGQQSIIHAEIEYADGRVAVLTLRPRAWYGSAQLMRRVWFSSAVGGGAIVLDVGLEAGDAVLPASGQESARTASEALVFSVLDTGAAETVSGVLDLRPYDYAKLAILVPGATALQVFLEHFADLVTSELWQDWAGSAVAPGTWGLWYLGAAIPSFGVAGGIIGTTRPINYPLGAPPFGALGAGAVLATPAPLPPFGQFRVPAVVGQQRALYVYGGIQRQRER